MAVFAAWGRNVPLSAQDRAPLGPVRSYEERAVWALEALMPLGPARDQLGAERFAAMRAHDVVQPAADWGIGHASSTEIRPEALREKDAVGLERRAFRCGWCVARLAQVDQTDEALVRGQPDGLPPGLRSHDFGSPPVAGEATSMSGQ